MFVMSCRLFENLCRLAFGIWVFSLKGFKVRRGNVYGMSPLCHDPGPHVIYHAM